MTVRWQERKLDDDLLKRELLLRLRAEHRAAPGRSRPATDYFRSRVRQLMLRHPLFAIKYHLLAIDPSLGRPEAARRKDRLLSGFREKLPGDRGARAIAGTLVVLGAAAATAVAGTWSSGPHVSTAKTTAAKAQRPLRDPGHWWHPPRAVPAPSVARQPPASTPKLVERPAARPHRRPKPTVTRQAVLVSNTVPSSSVPSTSGGAASAGRGPTPLKAPKAASGGAPKPLKAPRR